MKKCIKCNTECDDNSQFCSECCGTEFKPLDSDSKKGVTIGDNSAVSAHDMVSGDKDQFSGNKEVIAGSKEVVAGNKEVVAGDKTSYQGNTVIHNGASAEEVAGLLKMVLQENNSMLERQMAQINDREDKRKQEQEQQTSKQGGATEREAAPIYLESDIVDQAVVDANNLAGAIQMQIEKIKNHTSPTPLDFVKQYRHILSIVFTIFLILIAAASVNGMLWLLVIISIVVSAYLFIKKDKSRISAIIDEDVQVYNLLRAKLYNTYGEVNEVVGFIQAKEHEVSALVSDFQTKSQKNKRTALYIIAAISLLLAVIAFNITKATVRSHAAANTEING